MWIYDDKYHYTAGYYTTNSWIDNDTVVLARSENALMNEEDEANIQIVLVSLNDGAVTLLCDDLHAMCYLVHGKKVYYTNRRELKVIDTENGWTNVLYTHQGEEMIVHPAITNDGDAVCVYAYKTDTPEDENQSIFLTIDTKTGQVLNSFTKEFAPPFCHADHGMLCPVDKDIMFFAHEGNTRYISNRLWLHNAKTGEFKNIAKQKLDADGNLGDCFGHEMWAPDGRGLYFSKYAVSPQKPTGICYVDIETGEAELLYTGYTYWHTGVSPDGKFIVADTWFPSEDISEIVVVNIATSEEILVDKVNITGKHPCHPHPQMSPDGKKIIYTALCNNNKIGVKITNL